MKLEPRSKTQIDNKVWLAGDLVKVLHSSTNQPLADEYQVKGFFFPPRAAKQTLQSRHGSGEFAWIKNMRTNQEMGVPLYQLQSQGGGAKPYTGPARKQPQVTLTKNLTVGSWE